MQRLWRGFAERDHIRDLWDASHDSRHADGRDEEATFIDHAWSSLMGKTYTLGLSGESFANPDGSSRQTEIGLCRAGDPVTLVRDPDNEHDENAIAALSRRGVGIGMIARDNAEWLPDIMDRGRSVDATIKEVCQAKGTRSKGVVIDCNVDGGAAPAERKGFFARLFGK